MKALYRSFRLEATSIGLSVVVVAFTQRLASVSVESGARERRGGPNSISQALLATDLASFSTT